jgi:hypothetical protein
LDSDPALVRELRDIRDELVNISKVLEPKRDDEARFLIDQFNKYASWRTRRREVAIAGAAFGVTIAAVYVSWVGYPNYTWWMLWSMQLLLLVLGVLVFAVSLAIADQIGDYSKRLRALEAYRSQHRSLPQSITFEIVVESKSDRLKKLLKEGEPTATHDSSEAGCVGTCRRGHP